MKPNQSKKFLGDALIEQGLVSFDELQQALIYQQKHGGLIGDVLLELGFIKDRAKFLLVLSRQLNVDFVDLKTTDIPPDVIHRLPAKLANFYKIIPYKFETDTLSIAMINPSDIRICDDLQLLLRGRVRTALASFDDIDEAIRKYYGLGAETIEDMMTTVDVRKEGAGVERLDEIGSEASISKFLNQMLLEAYTDRATDIHIEPFEDELKIRYRIDGVLYDAKAPKDIRYFKDALNSRIKVLSNLNIAEKRLPQDGRFRVRTGKEDLDLRVSFLPTAFGQSVVLRILNSLKLFSLEELGLETDELAKLDELINKPYGIIFVTGPTGSGKTTTLYSCLSRMDREENKIITIEDPVEYQIKGITQIQIHPEIQLTFAAGLRSMLRHDPDVMMVGEVRDFETAQITIQVALTGHLVFSTLHTNDAASAVTRLLDMGIEPFLIASSVECFIAQRLVRVLCPKCKRPSTVDPSVAMDFGLDEKDIAGQRIYEAKGCEACRMTGYTGREAICEFLMINNEIRSLIVNRATATQIKEKAVMQGMKTLRQHGWQKVLKGLTTPAEVLRVTHEDVVNSF
jgi:type IV pilus assembly protein PilB